MAANWPVMRRFDSEHLHRIALPLGGIGTGTVSLGGRGNLRDWEVMNRPAKGFNPGPAFFALWARSPGSAPVVRALEGPLDPAEYEGAFGSPAQGAGLPRFRYAAFGAAYPLGQVFLSDPTVPLQVTLQAFNPLVPADADASGIPVAILRFVLSNRTTRAVDAAVCGTMPNFIGMDGSQTMPDWVDQLRPVGCKANVNEVRPGGIFMRSDGVPPGLEQSGTMALALGDIPSSKATRVTMRTNWRNLSWGDTLLEFWDDFTEDGEIVECPREDGVDGPLASLAVKTRVPARGTVSLVFMIAWHFPNRRSWTPSPSPAPAVGNDHADEDVVGNYYATRFRDAWAVVESVRADLASLESRTVGFVRAFDQADLPAPVKEAALFNLTALRSQTCFRIRSGELFGFEGCADRKGCCHGSCTHVWNYEVATAFLFGSLARSMRLIEFTHALHPNGLMSFRVNLPLSRARDFPTAAADGQMGCFIKLYREWQLSGDTELLRRLWPNVRRAMEFAWIPGGWDEDRDGVMEGCQHNTMDVEYYGPNPQMQGWYLGALRACEEMGRAVGDREFAATCRKLFDRGSRWTDEHLWNGEYFEQAIRPPRGLDSVAQGLRAGAPLPAGADPEQQLGAGCLVDQLAGQFLSHVAGLGHILDEAHVRKTLQSIHRYNTRKGMNGHFNHTRSFALGGDSAMVMASYPKGRRPRRPFPYWNEVMTGFEYSTAVHMLQEGMSKDGLAHIAAIRDRYDGRSRNPFDEAECGHHYARAMASWAAVPALSGFSYSAVDSRIGFAPRPGRHFWSSGDAWGTCLVQPDSTGVRVTFTCIEGRLKVGVISLGRLGDVKLPEPPELTAGMTLVRTIAGRRRPAPKRGAPKRRKAAHA